MNEPLQVKNVGKRVPWKIRVLFFDPTETYSRINVDRHKRVQKIPMMKMFPPKGKLCRCGCKKKLTGKRTSWATTYCSKFAYDVYSIICGYTSTIRNYLIIYHSTWKCLHCDQTDVDMDHIVGVKEGGGGCWLSNFQLLCHDHHVKKTNANRKRK